MNLSGEVNNNIDDLINFVLKQNRQVDDENIVLLLEKLYEDLKLARENASVLQKNLNFLLINDRVDLSTKFVLLREHCDEIEMDNANLKEQVGKLNAKLKLELELLRHEFSNAQKEGEKKSEMELEKLRSELEKTRISFQTKEIELCNQLQATQAASALQCDEIESSLKRQLVDVSNKLRQNQNLVRSQQMEIYNLKTEISTQQQKSVPPSQDKNLFYFNESPVQKNKANIIQNISYRPSLIVEDYEPDRTSSNQPLTLKKSPVTINIADSRRNTVAGVQNSNNVMVSGTTSNSMKGTELNPISYWVNRRETETTLKSKYSSPQLVNKQVDGEHNFQANVEKYPPLTISINRHCPENWNHAGQVDKEPLTLISNSVENENLFDLTKLENNCPSANKNLRSKNVSLKSDLADNVLSSSDNLQIPIGTYNEPIHTPVGDVNKFQVGDRLLLQWSPSSKQKNQVLSLMQSSDKGTSTKKPKRKRKLYNPDEFEQFIEVNE